MATVKCGDYVLESNASGSMFSHWGPTGWGFEYFPHYVTGGSLASVSEEGGGNVASEKVDSPAEAGAVFARYVDRW